MRQKRDEEGVVEAQPPNLTDASLGQFEADEFDETADDLEGDDYCDKIVIKNFIDIYLVDSNF
jgi:hypothetical protein